MKILEEKLGPRERACKPNKITLSMDYRKENVTGLGVIVGQCGVTAWNEQCSRVRYVYLPGYWELNNIYS